MELSPTEAKSIAFREDIEIVWGRLLESHSGKELPAEAISGSTSGQWGLS